MWYLIPHFGLAEKPWSTEWRGISPPFFFIGVLLMTEKILSVFIDESGDFGAYDRHAPFYLVSMVFHDQRSDIRENIQVLDQHLNTLGYHDHAIHTGPIIRRESVYVNEQMEERKKLFNALFNFSRKLDVHYICVCIRKSECRDVVDMTAKLSRNIADSLRAHQDYLRGFDRIVIYYDNGQVELTKILTSVFNALFSHVEFRRVRPVDYKLFQVADLICTAELLMQKINAGQWTRSEQEFFCSVRDFKKNYWKPLQKKRL